MSFEYGDLILAIYSTQMVANLLLALLLLGLHRIYRRSYLLHWSLAWTALLVYHLGGALAGLLGSQYGSGHPLRIALSSVCVSAGYAHAAFLVTGTWVLVKGSSAALRRAAPWIAALTVALGVGSVVASVPLEMKERLFLRVGLRAFFAGLSFLATAFGVLRIARRERSAGTGLVACFFALSGLSQLRYFSEQLQEVFVDEPETIFTLIVPHFVDLLLQLMLATSLLVWFFEDDRRNLARTTRALLESQEALRQSEHLEAVGRLAGGVAHDFNNLLTVVRGHGELLLGRLPDGEAGRKDAQAIVRASERAGELVHDLLAFSRRQPLQPTVFLPHDVLHDMRGMIESVCGERVRVVLEGSRGLNGSAAAVEADRRQLELAFLNLAANARDAISDSGTVRIRTYPADADAAREADLEPGDYVVIEFADSGCGIPKGSLHRVFDPFYTTKSGKGTGLGLSSVFGIVKQAGGDVRVESEVGAGTAFRIWLPRARKPLDPDPAPTDSLPAVSGAGTVLLVEDDASVRDLAEGVLREGGYRVLSASDGQAGLDLLAKHPSPLDVLVTDVVMPGLGIAELIEGVRHRAPGVQVILVSGYAESAVLRRGIDRATTRFLAKPFTPNELLLAVRGVLETNS